MEDYWNSQESGDDTGDNSGSAGGSTGDAGGSNGGTDSGGDPDGVIVKNPDGDSGEGWCLIQKGEIIDCWEG